MPVCNVKEVAVVINPQLLHDYAVPLCSILVSLSLLFWFYGFQIHCLSSLSALIYPVFSQKALTNPLYATCPAPNNRQKKRKKKEKVSF